MSAALWLIALIGPFAGSAAALLAERLPRGEPVLMARSSCRGCGRVLGAWELLPLVSRPLLRGRCRSCAAPIPPALWWAEVIGLAAGLGAVWLSNSLAEAAFSGLWLWLLLALALADLRSFRLPDPLTLTLALAGTALALALFAADWRAGLWDAGLGAAIGAGAFWLIRLGYRLWRGREGMGLGDVKLMAGIGAGLGAEALPVAVLIAALAGLAGAALQARQRQRALRAGQAVPFGTCLALGAALVWMLQRL